MNINMQIEAALSGVTANIAPMSYPVENKPDEFITYTVDNRFDDYGDDDNCAWVYMVEITWFKKPSGTTSKKPVNYLIAQDAMIEALKAADFTVTSASPFFEQDTGYTGVIVTCQIERNT